MVVTQSASLPLDSSPPLRRAGTEPDTLVDTTQEAGPGQEYDSDHPPSGSDEEGFDEFSDLDVSGGEGGEGYGTQSEVEGEEEGVKYDTYGGKRKVSKHRLYFGSRGSYMGMCQVPRPGALHRRIDIKVHCCLSHVHCCLPLYSGYFVVCFL
jgi:hypothetical protein